LITKVDDKIHAVPLEQEAKHLSTIDRRKIGDMERRRNAVSVVFLLLMLLPSFLLAFQPAAWPFLFQHRSRAAMFKDPTSCTKNPPNQGEDIPEAKTNEIRKQEDQGTDEVSPSNSADEKDTRQTYSEDAPTNKEENGEVKKLSKNQLKRQQKWAQVMEVKRLRKEQEKNIKIAMAKAEGRDIEAERREMEERRKDGSGRSWRNDKWKERFEKNASKYQLCLDCSFENVMTPKEINSLASQIRFCYAFNKKAKHPVNATVTNLSGATLEHLQNNSGFDQWAHRAFEHTEQGLLDAYPDKTKLVYLTSDSENVLETLEDDKVYIIGGIVDRNRLKRAAINRAEELGIATAKLPITDYISMVTTKVLTCNHVFEILLKYRERGNDWKKAFLEVLPVRKDANERE
jgi:tRNA (guanine9-N1)-methyltransferase